MTTLEPLDLRRAGRSVASMALVQVGKYFAFGRLSIRQRLGERAVLWGRILFYFIILFIFTRVWRVILIAPGAAPGEGARQAVASYVWYLALTEWIMLSQPSLYLDIEADVRGGDVAYMLSRPVSYVGSKLAEGGGELLLRLAVLGSSGLVFARLLSGQWPSLERLGLAALVGLLASGVLLLSYAAVGLTAFWIYDCTPVYLIWQKLCFVLGGLMLPLGIYPEWLRAIAVHSPFPALLYGPGQLLLVDGTGDALGLAIELAGWGVLLGFIVFGLEAGARRRISRNGW
jgi:viologen exporter family transport system permease protein